MRTQGVKLLDPVLQSCQLDWLILSARECPNQASERGIIARFFRVPHEPWGSERAFVCAVTVERSRRRVLFRQESGLGL